jgi:hypothetical protein
MAWFWKRDVTLHLRSGEKIQFFCSAITKTYEGNKLTVLEADNAPHWPFYVRLDAIDVIVTRRVPFFWWASC